MVFDSGRLGPLGLSILALALAGPARAADPAEGRAFKPTGAAAERYGPGGGKCASSAVARQLGDEIELLVKQKKVAAPLADPSLCGVAESFIGLTEKELGGPPRNTLVALASQYFGRVTAAREVLVTQFETEAPVEIAERLLQPIQAAAERSRTPRWGIATQRVRRGVVRVALVLGEAPVELEPLPRRLEPGQTAPLAGTLADPALRAQVLISDARGGLTTIEGQGPAFRGELRCVVPGVSYVEVRARQGDAATVLASFPVGCGMDPPTSAPLAPPTWPGATAEQERKALELLNADRTRAGLKPLAWSDAVAGAARSVSEALRDQTGDTELVGRLKQAGIVSVVVLQSAAADRTIAGAQERLLVSPSNRSNLLSADVNLAGVGIVKGKDPDGGPVFYLTEVMVKELPVLDPVQAREELRKAFLERRREAKAGEVTSDRVLDELAQKLAAADAAAGGALTRKQQNDLLAPVNAGFSHVTFLFGAKSDLLTILADPDVAGKGQVFGVGVAQGDSPTLGKNAIFPCILLGVSRNEAGGKPAAPPASKAPAKPPPKKDAR